MLSARTQTLIAMLGSPNDGEALVACRKLASALKAEGMDFHDLARGVKSAPGGGGSSHQERKPRRTWRDDVADLMKLGELRFKAREWEFLNNVKDWRGAPTERQAKWLADLIARELT